MPQSTLNHILFALLLVPSLAFAHGAHGEATGLVHGLLHPLGGLDHLLAMLAVGFWAAQMGGRAFWAVPATFVGVMILGGLLGFSGLPLPAVEQGITASVLVLGLLIGIALPMPLPYSMLLVGVFALFHGYAHGAEMPATLGAGAYVLGFALATAALHLLGMGLGRLLHALHRPEMARVAGGAVALGGLYLAVA